MLLLGLAGLGRLQAYRFKLVEFEWDTAAVLAARERGTQHRLRTRSARSWLFYRIHFRVLWRLQAGRRATLYGYREVAAPGGELPVPLWFPTSGRLQLTGRLTVGDVFGLTRAQIRAPERRELIVRPGLLGEQAAPRVDVSISHDTTQRSQTADQEQYFMREYMPGDRLKGHQLEGEQPSGRADHPHLADHPGTDAAAAPGVAPRVRAPRPLAAGARRRPPPRQLPPRRRPARPR